MEIYSFTQSNGKRIKQFQSDFIMSRILHTEKPVHIASMYLEENGIIGFHQAVTAQLLLIVHGCGLVRGELEEFWNVQAGDAVFWEKGEWHETKSLNGLTAIVIEGEELDPSAYMTRSFCCYE
ncbi:cupin [Metabacillus sp. HB246100]|uniref:cupin n=1 Tax=Bacillus weihaiensis TaxID=1547283 RepID=UPI002355BF8D|nr:cupin [Bacillus weihaiensis]